VTESQLDEIVEELPGIGKSYGAFEFRDRGYFSQGHAQLRQEGTDTCRIRCWLRVARGPPHL
jgi:hypothetical protein